MANATAFDGLDTPGQGCDGFSRIPIVDDSQPERVVLDEVPGLTFKRYNNVTGADTAFVAWREEGAVDDGDQYFLFFTNQPSTPLDEQFIENYRSHALAVGNLIPTTITSGVQRCAVNIDTFQVTTDLHPIAPRRRTFASCSSRRPTGARWPTATVRRCSSS